MQYLVNYNAVELYTGVTLKFAKLLGTRKLKEIVLQ